MRNALSAYRLAIVASRQVLMKHLRAPQYEPAALSILRAVVAQYSGDVARAIALLRRALVECAPEEACYVVDLLGPIYVTLEDGAALAELLEGRRPNNELVVTYDALRSICAALDGQVEESKNLQLATEALADASDDPLVRARAYQRISLAAYRIGDHHVAARLATQSARLFAGLGSPRSAAGAYSVAYNVHHAVTMDTEQALECAVRIAELGKRSGDESVTCSGLAAQYEIFAELGREADLLRLRNTLRRRFLPDQYRERFASGLADVLPLGWRGDFAALRASVILLQDAGAKTRGERAVCLAVRAIAEAGLDEAESARRFSRAALFLSDQRSARSLAPYDLRYLRIARGVAGAACILVGDAIRGRRAFQTQATTAWQDLAACEAAADGGESRSAGDRIRGYVLVIQAARKSLTRLREISTLTPGELAVLRLLADGLTAPQIAVETKRSVHTVRAHTRAIILKMGVHGRYAAVKQARQLGVIPN